MNRDILKRSLSTGLFILSIFVVFIPNASAGFIDVDSIINVIYEETNEAVVPKSGVLEINLSTTFTLTGIWANFIRNSRFSLLKDASIDITLEPSEDYDWIDTYIYNSLASLRISKPSYTWKSVLSLTVTEKAPAFTTHNVTVKATSNRLYGLLFDIAEKTEVFEVPFKVGYWPVINYELAEGNYFEFSPNEQIDIPIEVTNLGNGPASIDVDIILSPEDWNVSITSPTVLEPFDGEGQIILTVAPEGHHFERETIKLKFTPHYFGNPDLKGQSVTITFVLENDGYII